MPPKRHTNPVSAVVGPNPNTSIRGSLQLPCSNREAARTLWTLGWPILLQTLLAASLGLVDTLMVSAVGPAALAGVGLVSRLLFVLIMVLAGLASGTAALVAQYAGAGRLRATRGPVTLAVTSGIVLTLPMLLACLFWARPLGALLGPDPAVAAAAAIFLQWGAAIAPLSAITLTLSAALRSAGNTRTPMLAGLSALGLNTFLNLLFINGHFGMPALGVAAAAGATTAARLLEALWLVRSLAPGPLHRLWHSVRRADWHHLQHGAGPLMAKEVAWAGGILASTLIISRMGQLPLAAFNLVLPVEGILISVVVSAGVATGILLGHALGRGEFDATFRCAEQLRQLISRSAFVVGLLLALLLQLLARTGWLDGLIDASIRRAAIDTLSVLCVAFGARAHNCIVSVGILRSGADTRWMFWVDLCSMWLINIPMVAVAALWWRWPLPAVVGVMLLEEVLKVAVFRWRVRSRKWVHRVGATEYPMKSAAV